MKKRLCLYLLMVSLGLLFGCTQNDGHIGPVFGSWALVDMTEDGLPLNMGDETVICFQNEVVKIVRMVNPPYSVVTRFGTFSLTGDVLTMRFQLGPTPSGSYMYMAPEWLYFPQDGEPIQFHIMKLKGNEMQLSLVADGKTYIYSFRKTW